MKISSIFYALAAYTLAGSSASPIKNDASSKLAGINNSTNPPNNSNLLLTYSKEFSEGYPKDLFFKPEEPSSWYDLKKFINYLPISWFWKVESNVENNKEFELQGSELPNLFAQDNSMGSERGCKKFKDNNGTTISSTFNVDYTPDNIKPKITSFLGMKGCDVREVSTGHIVAKNCNSISLNLCNSKVDISLTSQVPVDVTISDPSEVDIVDIIGGDCDSGVC